MLNHWHCTIQLYRVKAFRMVGWYILSGWFWCVNLSSPILSPNYNSLEDSELWYHNTFQRYSGWLACLLSFPLLATKGLGHPIFSSVIATLLGIIDTALSRYCQAIQDVWLVCPSLHLLAKSTKSLGHPTHLPYPIVKVSIWLVDMSLPC